MTQSLNDKKPLYLQVREQLEDMIVKGQLLEGDQTPSTTELANFYKINHITVGKGVNQLVDSGILYKKRGIGMFVTKGAREKLLSERRQQFVDHYIYPLLEEAEKLELSLDEISLLVEESLANKGGLRNENNESINK